MGTDSVRYSLDLVAVWTHVLAGGARPTGMSDPRGHGSGHSELEDSPPASTSQFCFEAGTFRALVFTPGTGASHEERTTHDDLNTLYSEL